MSEIKEVRVINPVACKREAMKLERTRESVRDALIFTTNNPEPRATEVGTIMQVGGLCIWDHVMQRARGVPFGHYIIKIYPMVEGDIQRLTCCSEKEFERTYEYVE